MTAVYDPSLAAEFDLPTTPSRDQAVRNLIGRVIDRTCEPGTDHEAYQLADAARGLLAENVRLAAAAQRVRDLEDDWNPPKRPLGDPMEQFDSGYCNALVDVRRLLDGDAR
jgi:hypothetical protein